MTMTFCLPAPPSANSLFRNVPGVGRVRTARYKTWAQAAGWALKLDGNKSRTWETINGPVALTIICGARGDLDNKIKALADLLVSSAVIKDDDQVVDIRITRGGSAKEAIVTVKELAA